MSDYSQIYGDLVKTYAAQEEELERLDSKLKDADAAYGKSLAELETVQEKANEYRALLEKSKVDLIEKTQSAFYKIKAYNQIAEQRKVTLNELKESDKAVKKIDTALTAVMQDELGSIQKLNESLVPENAAKMNAEYLDRLEEASVALQKAETELKTIKYESEPIYEAPQDKFIYGNSLKKKLEQIKVNLKEAEHIFTDLQEREESRFPIE